MPEITNGGVKVSYDVVGSGRPLVLLHGWCCDRSWFTEPGYVEELRRDHRVVNVDLRGHGASDKPHDGAAYHADVLVSDVLGVADAEGFGRFAIWGMSYGGWIAWMTAAGAPERVAAIITAGAWDPRPEEDWAWFDEGCGPALRSGGTRALVELFAAEDGDAHDREFPPWARAVTLRADPEALIAANAPELRSEGLSDLGEFSVPAFLIAGELEDRDDGAARIAQMLPRGQRLRLPGLGHGGAAAASDLVLPDARAFLDRWFPWPSR